MSSSGKPNARRMWFDGSVFQENGRYLRFVGILERYGDWRDSDEYDYHAGAWKRFLTDDETARYVLDREFNRERDDGIATG